LNTGSISDWDNPQKERKALKKPEKFSLTKVGNLEMIGHLEGEKEVQDEISGRATPLLLLDSFWRKIIKGGRGNEESFSCSVRTGAGCGVLGPGWSPAQTHRLEVSEHLDGGGQPPGGSQWDHGKNQRHGRGAFEDRNVRGGRNRSGL
jgi:hypothetical protein